MHHRHCFCPSVVRNLLNVLMLLISCHYKRLTQGDIKGTGVCLCFCGNVRPVCECFCMRVHAITQPTGPAVITAEFIVTTEWTEKNPTPSHFLPQDWPTEVVASLQLAPNFSPSRPIGPSGVVAWLHQKLIYLSGALDVYCSTFPVRVQSETTSLTHTYTHTHVHAFNNTNTHTPRYRGRHTMRPGGTLALLLDLLVLTLTPQSAQLG